MTLRQAKRRNAYNERHLRRVLRTYIAYYQRSRTHLALGKDAPVERAVQPTGRIVVRAEVGGLHADIDTFDRSGMWINAVPEGFKVIDITKGGPAEASGLATDNVITAINGKSATDMSLPLLREMWRNWKPGTTVRLTVKGKGDVKITLRDQI